MEMNPPVVRADLTTDKLGLIAYDVVLSGDTVDVVAERNDLTSVELQDLFDNNQHFISTVNQIKTMSTSSGDDAGFGTRLRSFAENALPVMNRLMADDSVTPELKVGIFKAYLQFIQNRDKVEITANGGGAVQVNFIVSEQVRGMKEVASIEH